MNKEELNALSSKRSKLIESLIELMDKRIEANQKELLNKILDRFIEKLDIDENGKVLNNAKNRKLLSQIDEAFKLYQKEEGLRTIQLLVTSVNKIVGFNKDYFIAFDGKANVIPIMPKVKEFMKQWLGIKGDVAEPNGYIDVLAKNETAKTALKNAAMKIVIGQEGFENARKQIRELLGDFRGQTGQAGLLEKNQRSFAFDLYSQIDRATSDVIRNDLGFNFAIYEGGIIEKSRIFCIEHEGNVYHVSEIQDFNPKEAKPPNYNPITDLGGYNCRHHLNWISDAMAKQLRPDAKYFIDGTAKEKGIKPPLNTDK